MAETLDEFLAESVLPEGILEYFDFQGSHQYPEALHINLEEKNAVPVEHAGKHLKSKGFFETKQIKDFPLRGKPVILRVKRRRWIDQDTGEYVTRDWNLVAAGTKLTQEFADFLKELDRI
jgi:hypothetical protein